MGWMGTADTHLSHQHGKLAGIFQGVFLGEVFLKHVLVALGCLILHSFLIALLCLAKLVAGNNENWINMSTPSIATYTFISTKKKMTTCLFQCSN